MMKKMLGLMAAVFAAGGVFGAGFGLYEASARGNAMGGALVGSTRDASAVYFNPANMTETTNVSVVAGATMVWLYSDVAVDGVSQQNMNPGYFCIPHLYVSAPVWGDLYFGLGMYCENGLGTKYGDRWALAADSVETTLEQFTLNPNLAYRLTDWWSVAGGMKLSYIYFHNRKRPGWGTPGLDLEAELEGDGLALGYNFGTTFELFDSRDYGRLALGVVYRSRLDHTIKGDYYINGTVGGTPYSVLGGDTHSDASARLVLPQSVVAGLNWDSPLDKWHAGLATTWTEWSSVDTIDFNLPARKPMALGGGTTSFTLPLCWENVWRFSGGLEYDVLESLALRCGYVYDLDPSSGEHGTTMLPGGDRHIVGLGFGYRVCPGVRLDLGYNLVMMDSETRKIAKRDFETDNAYSHMLSASLAYDF